MIVTIHASGSIIIKNYNTDGDKRRCRDVERPTVTTVAST